MNVFLDANICLDLLDSKRSTSPTSIAWYMYHKDNENIQFYYSSDFITTFYYILTEKRKSAPSEVVAAIEALSFEVTPFYLTHSDFVQAKNNFSDNIFNDFEDLMILQSAIRADSTIFVTNDKDLLDLGLFQELKIVSTEQKEF